MKMLTRIAVILSATLFCFPLLAQASELTIEKLEQKAADNYVEYRFHLNQTVSPSILTARIDDTLMVMSVKGSTTSRAWVKPVHQSVRRILLHPVRTANGAALRVRYFKSIEPSIVQNIRVRVEGNTLIAAVPNSSSVAKEWASHVPTKSKADATLESEAVALVSEKNDVDAENEIAIAPESKPSSVESKEGDEAASTNDQTETGIAATERSNTPTLIVAMLMMIGVAFVLLKKMKQMKPSSEGGPLIRPIGTHMLGPKQGLLLVDVAGEMVLLGTTDKGVQLLTKLEGNGIERSQEEDSAAHEQVSPARADEVENPFGKMLGQFRQASEKLKSAASTVGRPVGVANGSNSELNLLADENTYDRRDFKPLTPRAPVPPYKGQTSLQERDALIEKLRMLKGA